jgi:hypothetical protein
MAFGIDNGPLFSDFRRTVSLSFLNVPAAFFIIIVANNATLMRSYIAYSRANHRVDDL